MGRVSLKKGTTEYARLYKTFRGVERSGEGAPVSKNRLAYSKNMFKDYDSSGGAFIETVPGYRRLYDLGERIYGIFLQKCYTGESFILVHSGNSLYRFPLSEIDRIESPTPICSLKAAKSRGFAYGSYFYILDGEGITRVDDEGKCEILGTGTALSYVPTLYINGEREEMRNLLTSSFKESFAISDPHLYGYGSPGIEYLITDTSQNLCGVSKVGAEVGEVVYIPGRVKLGDTVYKVTEILEDAFLGNTTVKTVYIGEGMESIGAYAFYGAHKLSTVYTPSTLEVIGETAFLECGSLTELYLGRSVNSFEDQAFVTTYGLETIYYARDEASFKKIYNYQTVDKVEKVYNTENDRLRIELQLSSDVEEVDTVTIDGTETDFTTEEADGVCYIFIEKEHSYELTGRVIEVTGSLKERELCFGTDAVTDMTGYEAISGCTVGVVFDGRIFLSGNPALPNTVFFSTPSEKESDPPLYFGEYNYFSSGVGRYPVKTMLGIRESLAVFKSGDDGSGSIFYHTGTESGDDFIPKIYPVSSTHSGVFAHSDAISFFDDPVFVSRMGLSSLSKEKLNYERSVACRSGKVNFDLLTEELSSSTLTEWLGYLVLGVRGKIYLADSRSVYENELGEYEYEWFILDGIGAYENAYPVYRYSSIEAEGYTRCEEPDSVCYGVLYPVEVDGVELFCEVKDGEKYLVYKSDEMTGGVLSPATTYLGFDDKLFFGTESGAFMCFNSDKRGVAPDYISAMSDFDPEEYKARMGRYIHPYFYSFDSHPIECEMRTLSDDCDIPYLTKETVKNSLTVKCKSIRPTEVTVSVSTDAADFSEVTSFSGGEFDFLELDFGSVSFKDGEFQSLPIGEKERGWIEKQISISSKKLRSPIGIYSVSYRYKPFGKIRKK